MAAPVQSVQIIGSIGSIDYTDPKNGPEMKPQNSILKTPNGQGTILDRLESTLGAAQRLPATLNDATYHCYSIAEKHGLNDAV
jgi:hypothetical protein